MQRSYTIEVSQVREDGEKTDSRTLEFDFDSLRDFDRSLRMTMIEVETEITEMERNAQKEEIRDLNRSTLIDLTRDLASAMFESDTAHDITFDDDDRTVRFYGATKAGDVSFTLSLDDPIEVEV